MARGLPCISTDCRSGPTDIITPANGWLVRVGDVEQLTGHMQRIVDEPACLPSVAVVKASAARFTPANVTHAIKLAAQP